MQGDVSGSDALVELARNVDAHDFRNLEIDGLAEHARFGFNASHAPAYNAEAVYHCGVRVGAHERVGVENRAAFLVLALKHDAREVLHVYLVYDARGGRNYRECVESLLAPLEEFVALLVAFKLLFEVALVGVAGSRAVHLHGVVHDQIDWHEGFDNRRVFALLLGGVSHCGEVHEERHAGEVLQNYARHHEGHFVVFGEVCAPRREALDVGFGRALAVAVAQHAFKHYLDAYGEPVDVVALFLERLEAVDVSFSPAFGRGEFFSRIEWIVH